MSSRPRYETPQDVANEYSVISKFSVLFPGAEVTRLSDVGRAFTVLSKNSKPFIAVEIKTRNVSSYKYSTFMISKSKYDALCDLNKKGLYTGILVQWTDRLGFVSIPVEHKTTVGGRYDRNDAKDIETVVLIDTSKFNTVGGVV